MANVEFGNYSPAEDPKDSTQYVYYTREGEYLGGIAGSAKIFLTTKEQYDQAAKAKNWDSVNDESNLVKYNDKAMTHSDFRYIAYIISHESGESDIKELRCVAFTSHNRSVNTKQTWRTLLASSYSSVPNKKELPDNNDEKSKLARQAELDVLKGDEDITKGAEFWDGTDFLAWGNSEQNPYNKLGQNKFDEYKFVEIPKDVYDDFLAAQGSKTTTYGDSGKHDLKNDHGTHEHIKVKGKNGTEKAKIRYNIPADDFKDQQYWTSGNFYYETGAKAKKGISATITAGKSIFWKVVSTRVTPETPQDGQAQNGQQAQPQNQPQGQPGGEQPGQPQRPGQQPQRPGTPPQQPGRPPQNPFGQPQQPVRPPQRPGPFSFDPPYND